MPIYEYRCEACGHELDALRKISDPPLTDCPACGASALKKQISAVAFRLKGSGWYETDFKQNNRKNLHETGDKTADKPGGSGGGDKATTAAKSDDQAKSATTDKSQTPTKTSTSQGSSTPAGKSQRTDQGSATTTRKAA